MAKNSRRKRHRILAWIAAGAMASVVALVIVAVVIMLRGAESPPSAVPPGVLPPGPTPAHPHKPRPAFQDASCPDVQMISVPGTWESSPQQNPLNPVQFPKALLLKVTGPIAQQFAPARVQTYTVAYTAQFHNPLTTDNQMSYNDSRAEGTRAMVAAMTDMNNRCPLTSYVLIGFSQGAVIAGDVASDIGNGRGPVDEDLVLGVTLIADGRRQQGVGNQVPPSPRGRRRDHPARSPSVVRAWFDYDRPAAGRFWCARRPDQRDLRPGRPDLCGPGTGVQSRQLADYAEHPGRRRRPAGPCYVCDTRILEFRWRTGDRVDVELGASTYRKCAPPQT